MSDTYDVIVIGSGAGGGTLRPPPGCRRASGSCCSSAATGSPASRRTGWRKTCSSTAATSRRTPGTTPTETRSNRRCTTSSAGRPSSTGLRSTGCASRTSGSCATTTGSPPRGRSPTSEMEPYYTRAEQLYQVHGAARRGSDRATRQRALPVPGGLARAADPAAVRRLGEGRPASLPRPMRDSARRGQHAVQPVRALRQLRRLPMPRAREVRRRGDRRPPGARAVERHAAHRRRGHPARVQLRGQAP